MTSFNVISWRTIEEISSVFTRIDFTLGDDAAENFSFRVAVSQLLQEFQGSLIGFQAEDLLTNEFYCDDAGLEESIAVLKTIFPEPIAAEARNAE